MIQQNQFNEENLIAMIRTDCLRLAQTARTKLNEVIECLGDENHLGALRSFVGLDEDVTCLKVFLTRTARLTVRQTPNRLEQSLRNEAQKGGKGTRARKAKTRHSI
jgi:hypothetical protein